MASEADANLLNAAKQLHSWISSNFLHREKLDSSTSVGNEPPWHIFTARLLQSSATAFKKDMDKLWVAIVASGKAQRSAKRTKGGQSKLTLAKKILEMVREDQVNYLEAKDRELDNADWEQAYGFLQKEHAADWIADKIEEMIKEEAEPIEIVSSSPREALKIVIAYLQTEEQTRKGLLPPRGILEEELSRIIAKEKEEERQLEWLKRKA